MILGIDATTVIESVMEDDDVHAASNLHDDLAGVVAAQQKQIKQLLVRMRALELKVGEGGASGDGEARNVTSAPSAPSGDTETNGTTNGGWSPRPLSTTATVDVDCHSWPR